MIITLVVEKFDWPDGKPIEEAKTTYRIVEKNRIEDIVRIPMDSQDSAFIELPNGKYLKVTTNDRAWIEVVGTLPNPLQE